jgi:hypothetical protein
VECKNIIYGSNNKGQMAPTQNHAENIRKKIIKELQKTAVLDTASVPGKVLL